MTTVTCAIIVKEGKVLVTQRSERMPHALKWEFPGGKVKAGESPESCIVREIEEETGLTIGVDRSLPAVEHDYATQSIRLLPFICSVKGGTLSLAEHRAYRWVLLKDLDALDWLDADVEVVSMVPAWFNEAAGRSSKQPG